jgi:hypothetical protein
MMTPPIIHPVRLTEDDVTELKHLLEEIEQAKFIFRGAARLTDADRSRDHLKASLVRILNQIPPM